MSGMTARVDRETISDEDPRNAALEMLTTMLESAIDFAKAQDCEAQLRQRVKRLFPELAVPPAADLFGQPVGKASLPEMVKALVDALDELPDLMCDMVSKAPSRLTQRRLTASEHNAHRNLAVAAAAILKIRKEVSPK